MAFTVEAITGPTRMPDLEPITLIGGSTRAAAWSARRAFFAPVAADLYADLDLREMAEAHQVCEYPRDLESVLREPHGGGWMYCGGIENYADLIQYWSGLRPLLGNTAETVRLVRDPWKVASCLTAAGICCPELAHSDAGLPCDGTWLRKPIHSAGGQHIVPLQEECPTVDRPVYFQRRVQGKAFAACYLAAEGHVRLLGVTQQLLVPGTFRYCGSIGPVNLETAELDQFERIGAALARQFSLVGLFGVDALIADGKVWPVEVNPRYTASMEVLERTFGFSAVAWHVAACTEAHLPRKMATGNGTVTGKQVVFADVDVVIRADLRQHLYGIVDVPRPAQTIPVGAPILTVLRTGQCLEDVVTLLAEAVAAAQQVLIDSSATER